jgi:hypothetical protein
MSFLELAFTGDTKAIQLSSETSETENQDFVLIDKMLSEIEAEYLSGEHYRNDLGYLNHSIQY